MKKLFLLLAVLLLALTATAVNAQVSYSNYAAPQLEYITNSFASLWNKPKEAVLQVMSMFPDYICTDYGDQVGCESKYNIPDANNIIFLNFFTDDYAEHHDNLWKVTVTADFNSAEEKNNLFSLMWIDGLRPSPVEMASYEYPAVLPLYFNNEQTAMVVWENSDDLNVSNFLVVEYYNGYAY